MIMIMGKWIIDWVGGWIAGLKQNVAECMQLVRDSMLVYTDVMQLAQAISNSTTEVGEYRG